MWLIPHYYQSGETTCGAACLRMLAAGFGKQCDEETITESWATANGCTENDLVRGAEALDLRASQAWYFDGPSAVQALSQNTPFIASLNYGLLNGTKPSVELHFVVALELENAEVVYHDPADGPSRRAKLDQFLSAWHSAGSQAVRVWAPLQFYSAA
jgi:ABC-type bacteriocin/lantibiotic exporter with double-glycine peptidase domain